MAITTRSSERLVSNVMWSWVGVAVQLLPGFIVTPYLIIKLGSERYGIWALVFSVVGNFALVDLGFRSAAVRYTAHFQALGESHKINELVNTLLAYFTAMAGVLTLLTLAIWQQADRLFHFKVPPNHHYEFSWLVLLTGLNFAAGIIGGAFTGSVEGFHRFDISNRIFIYCFGARSVGWFVLLYLGYGLIPLGAWSLFINLMLIVMYGWKLYRIFPALRISPRYISKGMFRETFSYGIHTFLSGLATRGLSESSPWLIGIFRNLAEVAYYNFPLRLLQYGADAVLRVGAVLTPKTAELAARSEIKQVANVAVHANRYCLILFLPLTIFLGVHGHELFLRWVKQPDMATASAPLLPAMLIAYTVSQAAQFCSSSVLFGLGAQRGYAIALVLELILSVAGTVLVLPRYGILGTAIVTSALMVIFRGTVTPWLLCRRLQISFFTFMWRIFAKPILVSLPVWAVLFGLREAGITGHSLVNLLLVAFFTGVSYYTACYFTCISPEHKLLVRSWFAPKLRAFRVGAS
jgi:O-antigen/teichoic acid export membrane protein